MLDEGVDLVDQFLDASKRTAADGPLGDQGKPAFHLIQPRRVGRGVMNLVSRPLRQPGAHFGMFVRCVIVDDQVDVQFRRDAVVESAQKCEKLLMPCRGLHWVKTVPVAISSAANKVVVPWRT